MWIILFNLHFIGNILVHTVWKTNGTVAVSYVVYIIILILSSESAVLTQSRGNQEDEGGKETLLLVVTYPSWLFIKKYMTASLCSCNCVLLDNFRVQPQDNKQPSSCFHLCQFKKSKDRCTTIFLCYNYQVIITVSYCTPSLLLYRK